MKNSKLKLFFLGAVSAGGATVFRPDRGGLLRLAGAAYIAPLRRAAGRSAAAAGTRSACVPRRGNQA